MWSLILHGGAKEIDPEEEEAHRNGCIKALEAGRAVLAGGGTAVDAVEAAGRVLETAPTFNAGYGSALNSDGEVEMCAGIMEGKDFNVGAVAVIKGVRHPISVAKAMLHEEPILLVSDGARRFAADKQLELCDPADLVTPQQRGFASKSEAKDTIGVVALDQGISPWALPPGDWTAALRAEWAILRNPVAATTPTTNWAPWPFRETASISRERLSPLASCRRFPRGAHFPPDGQLWRAWRRCWSPPSGRLRRSAVKREPSCLPQPGSPGGRTTAGSLQSRS